MRKVFFLFLTTVLLGSTVSFASCTANDDNAASQYEQATFIPQPPDDYMNKVRITAIRQTVYEDLMAKYENPIEHTCDVKEGQQWISIDGQQPEGMCPSAWYSMREFVESLARGEGNFYDGWMKNPMSAMISCNDGFRPFSFYIEVI